MKENMDGLHQTILEIMDEIHRISEKHELHYVLLAGSLLGAVRHQGFIPWDDDLDIGMPRKDYEKFKSILDTELKDEFYYIDIQNHPHYALPFLKVMKKGTVVQEKSAPKDIQPYGIYVDVFPFDVSPEDKYQKKKHEIKFNWYQKLLLARKKYRLDLEEKPVKRFIYSIVRLISYLYPEETLKKRLEKSMKMFNQYDSQYCVNLSGSYAYDKERMKQQWLFERKLYTFEKRKYYGSQHYDDYLKHLYGDYMELPPKEDRIPRHEFEKLKF